MSNMGIQELIIDATVADWNDHRAAFVEGSFGARREAFCVLGIDHSEVDDRYISELLTSALPAGAVEEALNRESVNDLYVGCRSLSEARSVATLVHTMTAKQAYIDVFTRDGNGRFRVSALDISAAELADD